MRRVINMFSAFRKNIPLFVIFCVLLLGIGVAEKTGIISGYFGDDQSLCILCTASNKVAVEKFGG